MGMSFYGHLPYKKGTASVSDACKSKSKSGRGQLSTEINDSESPNNLDFSTNRIGYEL